MLQLAEEHDEGGIYENPVSLTLEPPPPLATPHATNEASVEPAQVKLRPQEMVMESDNTPTSVFSKIGEVYSNRQELSCLNYP